MAAREFQWAAGVIVKVRNVDHVTYMLLRQWNMWWPCTVAEVIDKIEEDINQATIGAQRQLARIYGLRRSRGDEGREAPGPSEGEPCDHPGEVEVANAQHGMPCKTCS